MKTLVISAVIAAMPVIALAHDGLSIRDAYARGANPKSGAAFMVIENHRKVDCTLGSVATEAAERAELHTSKETDGVMKMMPIEGGLTIPAEGQQMLSRGGDHLMLMGLKKPLADGDTVTVSFDFGDCGSASVDIPVDNKRTATPQQNEAGEDAGAHKHH